jgi:hypothetical protein
VPQVRQCLWCEFDLHSPPPTLQNHKLNPALRFGLAGATSWKDGDKTEKTAEDAG